MKQKLTKKALKYLMKESSHEWHFCISCGIITVICGYCGNSVCLNESQGGACIDDCEEAYMIKNKYLRYAPLRLKIKQAIFNMKREAL